MTPLRGGARAQRGFILPGVVMFVLVLTIIGLSLFSLSSYEAQFMYQTLDKTRAFYEASSAIDRVRFVLTATKNLGSVSALSGTGNIDYAVAVQGNDSTGAVNWNSEDSVVIRVLAHQNNVKRFVSAAFHPHSQPYDNLFSISALHRGLMNYKGGTSSNLRVFLAGNVWQVYQGTDPPPGFDWNEHIYPTGMDNAFEVTFGNVPPPQMGAFWDSGLPAPDVPVWDTPPGLNRVTLSAGVNGIRFFRTGIVDAPYSYNIDNGNDLDIDVLGIAVWMLDGPLRVDRATKVRRAPGSVGNDMLVLLSKKATDPDNKDNLGTKDIGFIFKSGLSSPDQIPIIIVSDGYAAIDSDGQQQSMGVNWISIYANFVWLQGPEVSSATYTFSHIEGANPQAEANLQTLLENGYLPNASPQRKSLTFIPGTWQELGTN